MRNPNPNPNPDPDPDPALQSAMPSVYGLRHRVRVRVRVTVRVRIMAGWRAVLAGVAGLWRDHAAFPSRPSLTDGRQRKGRLVPWQRQGQGRQGQEGQEGQEEGRQEALKPPRGRPRTRPRADASTPRARRGVPPGDACTHAVESFAETTASTSPAPPVPDDARPTAAHD